MWPVIARGCAVGRRRELDAVLALQRGDVALVEPDRNFDGDRYAVVGEHEVLQRLVPQLVVADGRDDERRGLGRRVLLAIDDDARDVGERRMSPARRAPLDRRRAEEVVRARRSACTRENRRVGRKRA